MTLEHTCVIWLCTLHLLTLTGSLASHLQVKHLGTNQVCNLHFFVSHITELCVIFGLIDVIDQHLQSLVGSLGPFCY